VSVTVDGVAANNLKVAIK